MNNYILSLGSNIGDRRLNLQNAIKFLSSIGDILKRTSIYETLPFEMKNTNNFYNMVVEIETALKPEELLKEIKNYEKLQGRDIKNSHMKPRTIDIDILLNEDNIIRTQELIIPHKEIKNRYFIVFLLNELNPNLILPNINKSVNSLFENFGGIKNTLYIITRII